MPCPTFGRHLYAAYRAAGRHGADQRNGASALRRLAHQPRGTRAVSQRLDGRVRPLHARRAARIIRIVCHQAGGRVPVLAGAAEANVRETLPACEAYAGFGGASSSHRLAVLLSARSGVGLLLLPRDRPAEPDRRDALQHPHVRQPDRRADHPSAGRVRAHDRHQGFVRRPGLHDADDRGGAAGRGPISPS